VNQEILIRPARTDDIAAIVQVHIKSWQETYPGIMPERKIASLNPEGSQRNWEHAFASGSHIFVAEVDGQVVGFVSGGKNRPQDDCETGIGNGCEAELTAMYMLRAHHGRGIGRMMFDRFTARMVAEGYHSMVLWVAEKNPTVRFYERMGGEKVDRRILMVCDEPVPVLAYRYWL